MNPAFDAALERASRNISTIPAHKTRNMKAIATQTLDDTRCPSDSTHLVRKNAGTSTILSCIPARANSRL